MTLEEDSFLIRRHKTAGPSLEKMQTEDQNHNLFSNMGLCQSDSKKLSYNSASTFERPSIESLSVRSTKSLKNIL